jgi:hypothetical protein
MELVGLAFLFTLFFWWRGWFRLMRHSLVGVAFGLAYAVWEVVRGQNWVLHPIKAGIVTLLFLVYFAFCLVFWDKKLRGEKFLEWE